MCLFCQIVSNAIPVKRLFEDERVLAFADIHPQAPTHILVIPKQHIPSVAAAKPEDSALLGHLLAAAAEVARQQGLEPRGNGGGYRLVINAGPDGGQTVDHLHLHLLGGRHIGWPPG
jgi:histidine triad (HIT) family protein